ncbi:hypothetical protein PTKIN_Ptkin04bG0125400 [Pterospermum kingtungense]
MAFLVNRFIIGNSAIFCEAVAINGVIVAIILQTKLECSSNRAIYSYICPSSVFVSLTLPLSRSKQWEVVDGGVDSVVDPKDYLQQQSKAFDKLTKRVEDRQLDSSRAQSAVASITASAEAEKNVILLRGQKITCC